MESMPRIRFSQAALNLLSNRSNEISVKLENSNREIKIQSASTQELKSIYRQNKNKKFEKFQSYMVRKTLLKGADRDEALMTDKGRLRKMYSDILKRKPHHYFHKKQMKFDWDK